jgi:hypothetical protein
MLASHPTSDLENQGLPFIWPQPFNLSSTDGPVGSSLHSLEHTPQVISTRKPAYDMAVTEGKDYFLTHMYVICAPLLSLLRFEVLVIVKM